MAAEKVTPETMAFMIRHTSGVICMPSGETTRRSAAPADGRGQHRGAAHRVHGVGRRRARHDHRDLRGGPRHDRAHAARSRHPSRGPRPPGPHLPAALREGGVLKRAGHTEAAVDLARLAGLTPAGVLAEVVNDDGTMQRLPQLEKFAAEHGLAAHLDRRPHPLPAPSREARAAGLRGPHPDQVRRLHRVRVRVAARRRGARRVCAVRSRARTTCGAGALRVPHR